MKNIIFITALCFSGFAFVKTNDIVPIAIGTACPKADIKLKATDETGKSLSEYKGENGLLVVFSCNTCPFVVGSENSEGWEGRYNGLNEMALAQRINMVLINSNEAKRDKDDSFEQMKSHAKDKAYKMPYLLDAGSVVANAFGAKTTPHVFLFDKNLKLVYRGSIDDNVGSANAVKEKYLEEALKATGSGKKVKMKETNAVGCSIKRK